MEYGLPTIGQPSADHRLTIGQPSAVHISTNNCLWEGHMLQHPMYGIKGNYYMLYRTHLCLSLYIYTQTNSYLQTRYSTPMPRHTQHLNK